MEWWCSRSRNNKKSVKHTVSDGKYTVCLDVENLMLDMQDMLQLFNCDGCCDSCISSNCATYLNVNGWDSLYSVFNKNAIEAVIPDKVKRQVCQR